MILAEPVGSCTDIVATVVRPLRRLYQDRFDVAPYGVILKPSHGRKILRNELHAGFSPKAAYIFSKQFAEADFVMVNRIDELGPEAVQELADLIGAESPGGPVSPHVGQNKGRALSAVEVLDQQGSFGRRTLDLDYDLYAEGEAEWDGSIAIYVSPRRPPFHSTICSSASFGGCRSPLAAKDAKPAHFKTIGMSEGSYGVANLVSSDTPPSFRWRRTAALARPTDRQRAGGQSRTDGGRLRGRRPAVGAGRQVHRPARRLNVAEADFVKKGDVVAEIDHNELDATIAQAQAEVAVAAAEVSVWRKLAAQAEAEIARPKRRCETFDAENKQYEILLADAQRRCDCDEKLAAQRIATSEVDDRRTEVLGMEAKIAWTQQRKCEAEQRIVVAEAQAAAPRPRWPRPRPGSGPPPRGSRSWRASARSRSSAPRSTAW